jgi:hypothetical protein
MGYPLMAGEPNRPPVLRSDAETPGPSPSECL